jgi:DNA polymerase III epsilon subunit-like protein
MISFDLETTGFSHRRDHILEVGFIKVGKTWKDQETLHSLVNPRVRVSAQRLRDFGHTQAELDASPTIKELKPQILDFMKGNRIVGYNVQFDKRFLVHAGGEFACFDYVDMLNFIRKQGYEIPDYKLTTVARFFGINPSKAHTALGDAEMVVELMRRVGIPE